MASRPDGSLVVDRHAPGRGAWLCREPATGRPREACVIAAVRRDAFRRAFRHRVTTSSEITVRDLAATREDGEREGRPAARTRRD